ncbi:MAG: 30S ribosomal protein S2 [archaeon]
MAQKELLVPLNVYLSTGIHIGMIQRLKVMAPYIYKVRSDKLAVFDIQKIDERIRLASQMLAQYEPGEILVVSRKKNGHKSVVMFAEAVAGVHAEYGRFMPGTLTNPHYDGYFEPKIIVITDPFADKQALLEAYNANIPVIGLCDTYNNPQYVDLIVPLNNKGKKSVALFFWILAREYLKIRGVIKGDAEFKYVAEDFEMPDTPSLSREDGERPRQQRGRSSRGGQRDRN